MKKPLLVFALQQEVDPRFNDLEMVSVLVTGIGKLNAALSLSHFLNSVAADKEAYVVINLGTAGSIKYPVGSLVEPTCFYERAVSFPSRKIQVTKKTDLPTAVCGSADVVEPLTVDKPWDVVDMESFALARICADRDIPFVCVKVITDVSEGNVYRDWKKNLTSAREKLYQYWNENLKDKSF